MQSGKGVTGQAAPAQSLDGASSTAVAWSLACILGLSALARLFHLGVPSLWWDEILTASVARYDLAYIWERSLRVDLHSPLFYILVKAVQLVDTGDAWMRLPFALAGLAGLLLVYRLGARMIGPGAALMATALAGANFSHLILSRQVRPYVLIFILVLLVASYLHRLASASRLADVVKLLACLAVLVFLHQSNWLVAAGAGLLMLGLTLVRRDRPAAKAFAVFSLGMIALAAAASPYILSGLKQAQWVDGAMTRLDLARAVAREGGLLAFFDYRPWTPAIPASLALLGFIDLVRRRPAAAWMALGLATLPLILLVALNYQYRYFSFRHLTFVLAPFLLLAGRGVFVLLRPLAAWPVLGLLIFVLGLGLTLRLGQGRLYDEHSYMSGWKAVARSVAGSTPPGSPLLLPDIPSITELNWYLDAYQYPNSLREQRVGPEDRQVELTFLDYRGVWDHGEWKNDQVLSVLPHWDASLPLAPPGQSAEGGGISLERFLDGRRLVYRVPRTPTGAITALPYSMSMDLRPAAFYGQVYRAERVMILPGRRYGVVATGNDRPGILEYRFVNSLQRSPQTITLAYAATVSGPGNSLAVKVGFDDEPLRAVAFMDTPQAKSPAEIRLDRSDPYRTLTVRFELVCGRQAPSFGGENLDSLRLEAFGLQAVSLRP